MRTRQYSIDGVTITAKTWRTAVRRVRGYQRGELDLNGKTILASKRKPPGRSLRKEGKV